MSIEQARKTIHDFWMQHGEVAFAVEVLWGMWDHRSDVRAALNGTFDASKMEAILSRGKRA